MNSNFLKIKNYLLNLEYDITTEDPGNSILVVASHSNGIHNLVIAISEPIVIFELLMFETHSTAPEMYLKLLQKNRDIIHGAFALDETGTKVIFRDTLQVETLDHNEIEATLNSLALLLAEYKESIIAFSTL